MRCRFVKPLFSALFSASPRVPTPLGSGRLLHPDAPCVLPALVFRRPLSSFGTFTSASAQARSSAGVRGRSVWRSGPVILVNVRPRNAIRLALAGGAGSGSIRGGDGRRILVNASGLCGIEIQEARGRPPGACRATAAGPTSA